MLASVQEKLFTYIDAHISRYLDGLTSLCRQPGTANDPASMHEICEYLIACLQKLGFTIQLFGQESPLIYAELHTGAAQTLLLYDHSDIQLPEQLEQWQSPPFSPQFRDGLYYACGVARDKGNIAARLAAIDAYQQIIGPLPINMKWLIDGERGSGSPHLSAFLAQHASILQANGCLWGGNGVAENGTPIISLGTKGLLQVALEVQTAATNIHSMHGAILPNAVWRLVWALNSLKDAREEVLIEGFYDTLTPGADNEIIELESLPDNSALQAQQWQMDELLLGLKGFQLHYTQFLIPTCTINGIISENMLEPSQRTSPGQIIPSKAKAYLDFHLVPDQDPQDIYSKLQKHLKTNGFADLQTHLIFASHPAHTPIDSPFVQLICQAAFNSYALKPYILPLAAENYPMYQLQRALDLPCAIVGVGYERDNMDAPNEHIRINDFMAHIKYLTMIFEEGRSNATHTTA